MIGDAADIEYGAVIQADLCIVGAGAAGITMALQFLAEGWRVILLESGGLEPEAATQSLYEGEVADTVLHPPADKYRVRRFGGSTTIWGGRCVPFDPIDFARRDYIPASGWPFGFDDLLRYYRRANALCEAGRFAYRADEAFPGGMRPIIAGFAGVHYTTDRLERFSCPTDFGYRYRHRLAASRDVTVLLHANCTRIETRADANGATVSSLAVRTLKGHAFTLTAGIVVLATGGLETPRLLLATRTPAGHAPGNAHDILGRYYMSHIAGTLGYLRVAKPISAVSHGYERSPEGVYCRRRFALTETAQRTLRVGNFIARLHHPRIPDPAHGVGALSAIYLARHLIRYEYGKRLQEGTRPTWRDWFGHLQNVVTTPRATLGFLAHWARRRTLATRKFPSVVVQPRNNAFSLDFHAEQEPNPESRVTLGTSRDALGMARLHIDWRYTERDLRTILLAMRALRDDFAASGCGELDLCEETLAGSVLRDGAYGGHHIGTARIGATPRTGVVDADCRVHGTTNLFLAGSAVFPTSGQANPTLTIVALALRLADHLKNINRPNTSSVLTRPRPVADAVRVAAKQLAAAEATLGQAGE